MEPMAKAVMSFTSPPPIKPREYADINSRNNISALKPEQRSSCGPWTSLAAPPTTKSNALTSSGMVRVAMSCQAPAASSVSIAMTNNTYTAQPIHRYVAENSTKIDQKGYLSGRS
jgi:hypothetical protein